jgi:hypothetical protein
MSVYSNFTIGLLSALDTWLALLPVDPDAEFGRSRRKSNFYLLGFLVTEK